MKILVIEDDIKIIKSIEFAFKMVWPNAELISAEWGQEGIDLAESESPDLIIVDIGLPDLNGLEIIKQIRLFSQIPIMVLTVESSETMVVQALELGANDYVTKPFRQMELVARAKNLQKLYKRTQSCDSLVWGNIVYDYNLREITLNNRKITLTCIENEIFNTLVNNSPNVVTYHKLAEMVWGDYYGGVTDSLKVHINHIRKKIEIDGKKPQIILSKLGVGYYAVKPAK